MHVSVVANVHCVPASPSTTCDHRWFLTTSPSPRAPPCRSVSPASRETRCAALHSLPTFIQHRYVFICPLRRHLLCEPTPSLVQGGDSYAEGFGISILIPKNFRHESFEAEETAKELTKKIKAEEDAKEMAKESAASKRATVAPTKKKTHQKPAKDTKTTEQTTTAPAPAKEDAPV